MARGGPLHQGRSMRWLCWLGLFGIAAFTMSVLALHAVAEPAPWHMSGFANTRYWLLWGFAIYMLAIGGAALTLALTPALATSPAKRVGMALLTLAGIGTFLIAVFPMDRGAQAQTLAGAIHNNAAMGTFAILGVTMVVLAPAFRASPGWRRFAVASAVVGVLVAASCASYLVATFSRDPLAALSQRVLVALVVTWFLLVGVQLLRLQRPAPGPVGVPPAVAQQGRTPTPAPFAPRQLLAPTPMPSEPTTASVVRARQARARPKRIPIGERRVRNRTVAPIPNLARPARTANRPRAKGLVKPRP